MAYIEAIKDYWTTQVEAFVEVNIDELTSGKYQIWLSVLEENMPAGSGLSILDVGCGPGFFAIVMSKLGHKVTAVDYNEGMLEQAEKSAKAFGVEEGITFRKMDAQHLDFKNDVFDVVLSRSVTWVLETPSRLTGNGCVFLSPRAGF